jgi:myo-inositol-1(or 4)-monophosphatase
VTHDLETRLAVATRLAAEAGRLALSLAPPPGAAASLKGAQDWLTEADGAVEAFLKRELAAAFPEDGFQGEETCRGPAGASVSAFMEGEGPVRGNPIRAAAPGVAAALEGIAGF